ncbi:MAG: HAMP domain-containing sensor histidine kinase, partial [Spirochaetaceae bacterium]|nr:HAMP domain-containing sensor histidine kinase [Spirochaetaceae bacterium]
LEIEERKLAEARTQKANEEKLEFLSGLLAVVSHEVNTPAGVSVTAASHLQSLLGELRESYAAGTMDEEGFLRALDEGEEAMRIVLANLGRVADIVRSFRKIAADQQVEEKRRFDVKEYLDGILLGLKPKLVGTSPRIVVACPPGLEAETTPAAFYQIIANLILNSLMHAFPDGGSGMIEISVSDLDGDLEIAYRDDGVGIPGENLGQIFKPFFTTARARGGTGMGLYIVSNLVARLGGELSCESEPGQGARFRILLRGAAAGSETRHGR